MADALVSALAQTILGNLNSVVLREIGVAWGLTDELNNLESTFTTIQLVLQDAELKQRKTEAIQNWLRKLKNAAYDADNVLDEISTEGLRRRANSEREEIVGVGHEQDDLSVYAIWGMGGLGKTTLAQLIYNDGRIEKHFELRIWVCVSDDFSIQRLLSAIIQSTGGGGSDVSELDPLQCLLREKLRGWKFLLVLDDVWNEDHNMWDGLKKVLRCGSKGSMLMVTTRIEKVAIMMATIAPYNIGNLSEDDSWSLFKQRAFTTNEVNESLVAIGKAIVKKCGGVPLAIKALGSLMRFKSHESEWLAIKESEIWHLHDDDNRILPTLKLSYDNLIPHMRQCFAYCCIFPKDHKMEANQLVQLWMANGFIPSEGQTDLHLAGHLIFKELVWRSFLQDVQPNIFGGGMTCKMHDLALSVMRHKTYIVENGRVPKFPKMLRHLGLDLESISESTINLPMDDSLRSLIVHRDGTEDFVAFISKQRYLRVLVMPSCGIQKSPNLLHKLVHLRNLTMSCGNIKKFPESLTCLYNLQTLKLTYSEKLLELPKRLKVMKNLWFLEMDSFASLLCTPPALGNLTCLHSLSIFIVGQDASHQINQLKELNLGGKLSLQGLENVRSLEDAKSANLMAKRNLTCLILHWKNDINENSAEEVLEGLQPHENLEKMSISSYQGSRFPNWMSTVAFKHLKEISLTFCGRCEHLPALGKLPSLTQLRLYRMDSVKHLGAEWYENGERSFPALESLRISEMPNLEEWNVPDSVQSFPCLKDLYINGCPKLTKLPFLPTSKEFLTLEKLEIWSCPSITSFPAAILKNLSSLTSLRFLHCDKLNPLSGPLRSGAVLEHLWIVRCPELKHFPESMQKLSCLKELWISYCEGLRSLPDWLGSLQSLRSLSITGCPDLEKRCEKPNGEDWLTISHIPKIIINGKIVQNLDI
ncbi:hypothetical protein BUALT_Bualt18G0055800 [Buddleja alternifolia]|uniref:Disease resistance protein RGA3 n=1 Tax=Buddleja alternifolia TaxID=168488 RepID=A0AAV6WD34_9LAMI|nr:hypothetical protein BUALT_Bualt18G0055800 [Buddleja alternifolia]